MNHIYIPPMKLDGQAKGRILRQLLMFRSFGIDSQVRMRTTVALLLQRELGISFSPSKYWELGICFSPSKYRLCLGCVRAYVMPMSVLFG